MIFADLIHEYLFNPITVATALVVGGIVMLWAERRQHEVHAESVDDITWKDALKVGFAQCLAMIPGTSRSGSTIIGGLLFGLSRKTATEFSFFLAMPTMVGAAVYSGYKYRNLFVPADFSSVRHWLHHRLHLCDDRRSGLADIHRQPQLRDIRLVSHCVRSGDPGHLAIRLGRLDSGQAMNDSSARNNTPGRKSGGAIQNLRLKLLVFVALCAVPLFGSVSLWLHGVSMIPLAAYGIVSVLAFFSCTGATSTRPAPTVGARRRTSCTRWSWRAVGRVPCWPSKRFDTRPAKSRFSWCSGSSC